MKGGRSHGRPVLVRTDEEGGVWRLDAVPLTSRSYDEGWLQELVRSHPGLLSVGDIEQSFDPPISIGREVETDAGFIDNLFISPDGYLTIVETKLWRNPQARREVIAQVIDYAKALSKWEWEDLDGAVRTYNSEFEGEPKGLVDTIRGHREVEGDEEARLVDSVVRNLRRGRVLLLIVGEGIRENVESIVEFIQDLPQLLFTLAMVELRLYRVPHDDDGILVVPNVVVRTREVVRAVVRVEGVDIDKVEVGVDTSVEPTERRRRVTISEDDFFDTLSENASAEDVAFARLVLEEMEDLGCIIDWKSASYVVKYPDPNRSGQNLTLFVVTRMGNLYVGWLDQQLGHIGLPREMGRDFVARAASVTGVKVKEGYPDTWVGEVPLSRARGTYPEFKVELERFIANVEEMSAEEG